MIQFRRPTPSLIATFLAREGSRPLTYTHEGATVVRPPHGFVVDHNRARLGQGAATFQAARAALCRWQQFQLGWLEAIPHDAPHEVGQAIAVVARVGGFYWINACRLVHVIDEVGPLTRYGFAYGTLPEHVESGEERFLIEWDQASGEVVYDILAFSRPRHPLARLGYPIVRRLQKRFARDSIAAMLRL